MQKKSEVIWGNIIVAVVVIGIVSVIIFTAGSGVDDAVPPTRETTHAGTVTQSETTQNNDYQNNTTLSMNENIQHTQVTFKTNEGDITLELFDDLAPHTVQNFLQLAQSNFYDGVKFHRVIDGFMIQGGDPQTKDESLRSAWGTGGPGYTFADEIHAENNNVTGTIAMANAGPNTNGSQFFINVANNRFLDDKHTVFGKVIDGMDIVNMIAKTPTLPNDQPIDDIIIESVVVTE